MRWPQLNSPGASLLMSSLLWSQRTVSRALLKGSEHERYSSRVVMPCWVSGEQSGRATCG
jgi:hypothetical protein